MPRSVVRRVVVACTALVVLSGCGSEAQPRSVVPRVVPDAELCPERLFQAEAGDGLGVENPADSAPDLPAPDRAWICSYWTMNQGLPYQWGLISDVQEIVGADLQELAAALDGFTVGSVPGACTADLGSRLAVVVRAGDQQYAVLKDMFSCGDVRLTDDLGTVAAGEPAGHGTVGGIVGVPDSYLDLVARLGETLTYRPPAG